ncbi:MAG: hypothetical protein EOP56_10405 [Sphingobacteriales bacterium]|nr:MAG: hypothetical protein EOP56_10405 [Sphingobacteriales bacterium]
MPHIAGAQKSSINCATDTASIISIAKAKHLYNDSNSNAPPLLTYNAQTDKWMVKTVRYRATRKGKCAKVNGCTICTITTLTIDCHTGKVVDRKKETRKFNNYE